MCISKPLSRRYACTVGIKNRLKKAAFALKRPVLISRSLLLRCTFIKSPLSCKLRYIVPYTIICFFLCSQPPPTQFQEGEMRNFLEVPVGIVDAAGFVITDSAAVVTVVHRMPRLIDGQFFWPACTLQNEDNCAEK